MALKEGDVVLLSIPQSDGKIKIVRCYYLKNFRLLMTFFAVASVRN